MLTQIEGLFVSLTPYAMPLCNNNKKNFKIYVALPFLTTIPACLAYLQQQYQKPFLNSKLYQKKTYTLRIQVQDSEVYFLI